MQVKFTPIRVVCQNTLSQALSRGRTYAARHDRSLRQGLRDVQAALGFIRSQFADTEEKCRRMVSSELNTTKRSQYFAEVFPDPRDLDDERARERADACRFWAAHFSDYGQGNAEKGVRGTLWAAYNGVTELVDHTSGPLLGPRAADNGRRLKLPVESQATALRHLESSWFGRGAQTKMRAWDTAVRMTA